MAYRRQNITFNSVLVLVSQILYFCTALVLLLKLWNEEVEEYYI